MTWPGTHPDTEAGKPNTTDPAEPANHTPTKAATPTTEWLTSQSDPVAWHATPAPIVVSYELADTADTTTPQPTSHTPDTDSANSDDPNTTTADSSNHHDTTDQPASDASDGSHR